MTGSLERLSKVFSRLSLKYKIFLGTMAVLVPILVVGNVVIYGILKSEIETNIENELRVTNRTVVNTVRVAADVSVRNYLRGLAESNLQQVARIQDRARRGEIATEEAKRQARDILIGQRVGSTGYIYVLDSQGDVVVHPNPGVEGTNQSAEDFVRRQMTERHGYLEYSWRNPGEAAARPKALYMLYFRPWDWIISVSSYREEFSTLVSVDDFRGQIENLHLRGSGYPFVFGFNGDVIIHPTLERNIFINSDLDVERTARRMIEMRRGVLRYDWREPGTDMVRQKISFFESIPEYGWVIGSAVYVDDYQAPLIEFRKVMVLTTVFTIVFVALMSIMMGGYVTRPLKRLLVGLRGSMVGGAVDDTSVGGGDEVRAMAARFADILERMRRYSADLETEVGEREKAEQDLRVYREIFENANEGITVTNAEAAIIDVNPAFTAITGYARDEALGNNPSLLRSMRHDFTFYKSMWDRLLVNGTWSGEIWNRRKDGSVYPVWLSISSIRNTDGEATHYIGVFRDISEAKEQEERIRHLAFHDALTGLPNRTLLIDRLQRALLRMQRENNRVAVIFIDMDNFKTINDSLGHAVGDQLLVAFAQRIGTALRSGDSLARLGGDEFVVVVEGVFGPAQIDMFASRIFALLEKPFVVGDHDLHVTMSVGITLGPTDGDDVERLLKNADMAMYRAKAEGKNSFRYYRPEMDAEVRRWHRIHSDIRVGLDRDEFQVYYQPKIDALTGRAFGMEALARWVQASGEVIGPNEFIPVAEEAGLIERLDRIILEKACRQTLTWIGDGHDLRVAVNLSPRHFHAEEMPEQIDAILAATGLPPERLEIEITENAVMADIERSRQHMQNLSKRGIGLAIDDFGRGYSSLSYVSAFPINTLKIDKKFIDGILRDDREAAVVETIIHMAKRIGVKVVAEGVEEEPQVRFLVDHGCDGIQGYYFSRPLTPELFTEFLKR